jgi:hypothetical protein
MNKVKVVAGTTLACLGAASVGCQVDPDRCEPVRRLAYTLYTCTSISLDYKLSTLFVKEEEYDEVLSQCHSRLVLSIFSIFSPSSSDVSPRWRRRHRGRFASRKETV